jgi:hypothetical protein
VLFAVAAELAAIPLLLIVRRHTSRTASTP